MKTNIQLSHKLLSAGKKINNVAEDNKHSHLDHHFSTNDLQNYSREFTPLKVAIKSDSIPFSNKQINYFKDFIFKHNSPRTLRCVYSERIQSYWRICEHAHNSIVQSIDHSVIVLTINRF